MTDTHHSAERRVGGRVVSCATCSEAGEEELIRTPAGWVITRWSATESAAGHSRIVSRYVAAQWLIRNGHALPEELADFNFEVS